MWNYQKSAFSKTHFLDNKFIRKEEGIKILPYMQASAFAVEAESIADVAKNATLLVWFAICSPLSLTISVILCVKTVIL